MDTPKPISRKSGHSIAKEAQDELDQTATGTSLTETQWSKLSLKRTATAYVPADESWIPVVIFTIIAVGISSKDCFQL